MVGDLSEKPQWRRLQPKSCGANEIGPASRVPLQQYVDVSFRPLHFVEGCMDMRSDEIFLDHAKMLENFC